MICQEIANMDEAIERSFAGMGVIIDYQYQNGNGKRGGLMRVSRGSIFGTLRGMLVRNINAARINFRIGIIFLLTDR